MPHAVVPNQRVGYGLNTNTRAYNMLWRPIIINWTITKILRGCEKQDITKCLPSLEVYPILKACRHGKSRWRVELNNEHTTREIFIELLAHQPEEGRIYYIQDMNDST